MKKDPMILTIGEKEYTLEFNRETVKKINKLGFKGSQMIDDLETMLPLLWYGAFQMHHPEMKMKDTDKLLEEIEGLGDDESGYLMELYLQPRESMVRDGERKNSKVSITIPAN